MSHRTIMTTTVAGAAVLLLSACGGSDTTDSPVVAADDAAADFESSAVPFGPVGPAAAAALAADDAITVIDVRTPEEFSDGHLADAVLIDFYDASFADQLAELDRDGTYLLYCRSGNRSGQAASIMGDLGFEQVYDLQGGVIAYDAAGLPLEK